MTRNGFPDTALWKILRAKKHRWPYRQGWNYKKKKKEEKKTHTSFSVGLWSILWKIGVRKSGIHGGESCHCVPGSLHLWRLELSRRSGRSVHYVVSNLFCCSSLVESEPKWQRPAELKVETKKWLLWHKYWQKNHKKPAVGNTWLFSTFSGRLRFSLEVLRKDRIYPVWRHTTILY